MLNGWVHYSTGLTLRTNRTFWLFHRRCSSKVGDRYTVVSFYRFKPIQNPAALVDKVRTNITDWEGRGRIYFNKIGINAQYCLPTRNTQLSHDFFREEICPDIDFKHQQSHFQVFGRLRELQEIFSLIMIDIETWLKPLQNPKSKKKEEKSLVSFNFYFLNLFY